MTLFRGCHGASAGPRRATTTGLAAAAIMVGAIIAGLSAQAASAAGAAGVAAREGTSASVKHRAVRYYIVPAPAHGATETLYTIAARTLGNGSRFPEIFRLNRGRLQPDGRRMKSPNVVRPGWILRLPADARGAGVHVGPLPTVPKAPGTGRASSSPAPASRPSARPVATAAQPGSHRILNILGGALLVIVLATIAALVIRRPWRRRPQAGARAGSRSGRRQQGRPAGQEPAGPDAGGPRSAALAIHPGRPDRPAGGQGGGWLGEPVNVPPVPGGGRGAPRGDGPARPGPGRGPGYDPGHSPGHDGPARGPVRTHDLPPFPGAGGPGSLGPEHPSFPGAGHLGAVSAQRPRARSEVHRGGAGHAAQRPGPAYFDALGPEHPSFPGAGYLDAIGPEHPSFPGAGGDLRTLGPADSGPLGMAYYAPSAYAPPAPPRVSPPGSPGHGARFPVPPPRGRHAAQQVVELDQPAPQAQPAAAPRTSDSARLAQRMLAEADEQAARIITTAQQRAIEIGQSAAEKAAATREAAERETAELRTAVEDMTGELRRVAVDVVENLATPVKRATRPAARTTASPAARPAGETLAQSASGLAEQSMAAAAPAADPVVPGAMPRARPRRDADAGSARTAVKPGVSPRRAAKPRPAAGGQSRQARAWRRMVGALAILAVLGLGTAGVEVGLHGFSFFLFRNTGAGAGNSHDFEEDQGPGQSHAPGTHHDVRRSPSHGPSGKPR